MPEKLFFHNQDRSDLSEEKKPWRSGEKRAGDPFGHNCRPQWARSTKNPDVSTGPLARPFARGTVNDCMAIDCMAIDCMAINSGFFSVLALSARRRFLWP